MCMPIAISKNCVLFCLNVHIDIQTHAQTYFRKLLQLNAVGFACCYRSCCFILWVHWNKQTQIWWYSYRYEFFFFGTSFTNIIKTKLPIYMYTPSSAHQSGSMVVTAPAPAPHFCVFVQCIFTYTHTKPARRMSTRRTAHRSHSFIWLICGRKREKRNV